MPDGRSTESLVNEILALKSALYDRNTDLPSYPCLFDSLKQISQNQFLGVIYLGLSDQERVETVFGFERYEEVLRRGAAFLREFNRTQCDDTLLLAQRGVLNDEFCVFVPYESLSRSPLHNLEKLARQIYKDLRQDLSSCWIQGLSLHVGYSVLHYNPFIRFERSVHRALQEAAGVAGRQEEMERILNELELRQIIARRGLRTLFHPIVSADTFDVVGYEALTRGPKGTPYESPDALFACAQQSRLARELDRLCKLTAVASCKDKPAGTQLFVNTLPTTLDDPEFLHGRAFSNLASSNLLPGDIVWELTERLPIEDFDAFGLLMREYASIGYKIAIDDVGTGYSSIQTITHVRPLYLKIDISLVSRIQENLLKQELITSLVALAQNIRAEVIAEGVETPEELGVLKELGVKYLQGYLFGRPDESFPGKVTPKSG